MNRASDYRSLGSEFVTATTTYHNLCTVSINFNMSWLCIYVKNKTTSTTPI